MRMPFGKYRGYRLSAIPIDYIEWLSTIELRPSLKAAVKAELERRSVNADESDRDPEIDLKQIADQMRRRLAMEFHPDRGGSHEAMKASNRAYEVLMEIYEARTI